MKKISWMTWLIQIVAFASFFGYSSFAVAEIYKTDASGGEIHFHVESTLHPVHGNAGEWTGQAEFDPATGKAVTPFEIRIPVRSFSTANKARDRALLKMFENGIYPEVIWKVESWSCGEVQKDLTRLCRAGGLLTMHGKSSRHETDIALTPTSEGFQSKMEMDLTTEEFGLKPPSVLKLIRVAKLVHLSVRANWKKGA